MLEKALLRIHTSKFKERYESCQTEEMPAILKEKADLFTNNELL
jgi:uncharacterized protein YdaT